MKKIVRWLKGNGKGYVTRKGEHIFAVGKDIQQLARIRELDEKTEPLLSLEELIARTEPS